jgi:hypothetical protein
MSRLNSLSAAAIRAMFSSETDAQVITLITIKDPTGGNDDVRLADSFTGRLTGTTLGWSTQELETLEGYTDDAEVIYGVTFAGNEYWFVPMQINLPEEQDTGVGNISITINYVTQEAIALIRKYLTKPTEVNISIVLSSNLTGPNPEAQFSRFYIVGATYSAESIELQLEMINFTREPFPSFTFSPLYFPGLF